jgi:hypothetical protein
MASKLSLMNLFFEQICPERIPLIIQMKPVCGKEVFVGLALVV